MESHSRIKGFCGEKDGMAERSNSEKHINTILNGTGLSDPILMRYAVKLIVLSGKHFVC